MRQADALAGALADIFWRCGEKKSAVVAIPSDEVHIKECSTYVKDSVTEHVSLILMKLSNQKMKNSHVYLYAIPPLSCTVDSP